MKTTRSNRRKEYAQVHLPRTIESTVFDAFMALEVLIVWGIAAWLYMRLDKVPTHFNAAGQADAWGSHGTLIFIVLIFTFCMGLLAYSAYHPKNVNTPFLLRTVEEHLLNARLIRIMALIIGLLFILIVVKMGGEVFGLSDAVFAKLMLLVIIAVLGVSAGFYGYIYYKYRR